MTLTEYIVFAFSSIFVIVDPIATVPAFLAMQFFINALHELKFL